ncbi:MAG TPA: polysaccharide deacetylase family protein [Solirubrobacteraceae bacterium]|nr:polysaccharide deacetylase family protein [Solirubrobacteraceae bacterium]
MTPAPYDQSTPGSGDTAPTDASGGAGPPGAPVPSETRYRRRRLGAGLVLVGFVALIFAVATGGGAASHKAHAPPSTSGPRPDSGVLQPLTAGSPTGWTPEQTTAVNRVLRYTPYISVGSHERRVVALTFDDGPSTFTPQILDILRREHAPATFFEIGGSARQYPDIAREVLATGLPIGDHTETHPPLASLTPSQQRAEVLGAAKSLQSYGAPYPRLFRPPYGSFNRVTLRLTHEHHMLMVLWTVDTRDFSQPGVKRIIYTVISGAKPGAIILMHDGGGPRSQTVAALPHIIHDLRRRHYRLVTVPQLVLEDPPPATQSTPHSLSG